MARLGTKSQATLKREVLISQGKLELPPKNPKCVIAGKIANSVKYDKPNLKSAVTKQLNQQTQVQAYRNEIIENLVNKHHEAMVKRNEIMLDADAKAAQLLNDLVSRTDSGGFLIEGVKMQVRVKAAELVLEHNSRILQSAGKSLNDMTYEEIQQVIDTTKRMLDTLQDMSAINGEAVQIIENTSKNIE